jgi:glucans biosynthesis protein
MDLIALADRFARRLGILTFALGCCLLLGSSALAAAPAATPAFGFKDVVDKAKTLAAAPYKEDRRRVPDFLMNINFDQWRDIRFRTENSLWRKDKLPFEVQFFHPGLYYEYGVTINSLAPDGTITSLTPSPELFNYGQNDFGDKVPGDIGFAGFRVHCYIKNKEYKDEVIVFLGASYFRAIGRDNPYGLSARGLALNTASPQGEEFPHFKEFWLKQPGAKDKTLTVYALLDSQSCAGAYTFVIKPGAKTLVDVDSSVFFRQNVDKPGFAPLTSMFFYGKNTNTRPIDDFRPEVHDSDGLLMASGSGEWIWRQLQNPRRLLDTSYAMSNPRGFGLIQRDTDYEDYQDLEAHYHLRPSCWVAPKGDWGRGRVELVEIPSDLEYNDNIVAFWVPAALPAIGEPVNLAYTLTFSSWEPEDKLPPAGYVVATRTAAGRQEQSRKFIVDFKGGSLDKLKGNTPIQAEVSVGQGARLLEQQLMKNSEDGGWRLVFTILPDDQGTLQRVLPSNRPPIDLRAFLKQGNDALTETWSYSYLLKE